MKRENKRINPWVCVWVEEKNPKISLSGRITLTFTDPVQPLPLHFVFVSQGHGVTHSTAQDGAAQLGREPLLPQPQILTRFRHLVHCQRCSPGHTASAHTPARREEGKKKKKKKFSLNTTHTVHKHTRSCCMYTHYWCISTGEGKKKEAWTWEGIKGSLTTKSLLLTKSQGSCGR